MNRIVISYRRQDSADITGRIYDRLVHEFGRDNVFKDVDTIPAGVDFRDEIGKAVGQSAVFLAVIGDQWLAIIDEAGRRRIDNPNDFVRVEVEAALQRDIRLIPVLVRGATMPAYAVLPEPLRALTFRNAIPVRNDPDFHRDMDRLIKSIADIVRPAIAVGSVDGAKLMGNRKWISPMVLIIAATAVCLSILFAVGLHLALRMAPAAPDIPDDSRPAPNAAASSHKAATTRQWWNYYQQGIECRDRDDYAAAVVAFESAIGVRPDTKFSQPTDSIRVTTYGMHFIDDYFPNRELGIALYNLQRMAPAILYLEKSIKDSPSDRAMLYLFRARQSGKPSADPKVVLDPICIPVWSNTAKRILHGWIITEASRGDVSVNGQAAYALPSTNGWEFVKTMTLSPGTNRFRVEARDVFGHTASNAVVWVYDVQAPVLKYVRTDVVQSRWHLQTACQDNCCLKEVLLNDVVLYRANSSNQTSRLLIDQNLPLGSNAVIEAYDMANNFMRQSIAAPSPSPLLTDKLYPQIIPSDIADVVITCDEEYFLDGRVSDPGGIRSVCINGEQLLPLELRGAKQTYFARRLSLDIGTNLFELAAVDMASNVTERSITIIRKKPSIDTSLPTIAVLPLSSERGSTNAVEMQIKLYLESELSRNPISFRLLDWDTILRELHLTQTEMSDPAATLRIGKMHPVDFFLACRIIRENRGFTLYARIQSKNGKVLLSEDVYIDKEADLSLAVSGLVLKIKQHFKK